MKKEVFEKVISRYSNEISYDEKADVLFEQSQELINFIKIKGLTIRQAQLLLKLTSDFLLDSKLVWSIGQ